MATVARLRATFTFKFHKLIVRVKNFDLVAPAGVFMQLALYLALMIHGVPPLHHLAAFA